MFRLYIRNGCPHCQQSIAWFNERKIPLQAFDLGNDPVLIAGLKHWPEIVFPEAKDRNGLAEQVPLLFCFGTMQYVIGYRPEEYERMVQSANQRSSPSAFRVATPESNDSGQAAQAAGQD